MPKSSAAVDINQHGKLGVLVVEDDSIIALGISAVLEALGHRVVAVAGSAAAAVAAVTEHRPDLVLMDINLGPGPDGIEAARQIRLEDRVPIIYASAHGDPATMRKAQDTSPSGFLVKPYTPEQLERSIRGALDRT